MSTNEIKLPEPQNNTIKHTIYQHFTELTELYPMCLPALVHSSMQVNI